MPYSTASGPTVPESVISDGTIRVIFKIIFLVLILAIAFIGSYCVTFFIQRRLLKGKAVGLTATTGWIHGPALAKIAFQLRRLPGGWIGILMLLTTALELTAEFGIAKSITLVYQKSRSTYPSGMIIDESIIPALYPDTLYRAYTWATSAQDAAVINFNTTEISNVRPNAIYQFVNAYDYHFLPTAEDILGYWSCQHSTPTPVVYNQSSQGGISVLQDSSVLSDLARRGLMYPAGPGRSSANVSDLGANGTSSGVSYQVTLWSASNYTFGSAPNFTFGVQKSSYQGDPIKAMDVFQCSLRSNGPRDHVYFVLANINVPWVIDHWIRQVSGALYPGFFSNYDFVPAVKASILEYHLNALIMVAGSGQTTETRNTFNYSYGSYEIATVIPYWIIAITAITFALLLLMTGYLVFLWFSNRRSKKLYEQKGNHRVGAKEVSSENLPVGLLGWMSHAAAISRDADMPERGNLRKWILSTTWHGKRLGVVKEEEHGLMDSDVERKSEDTYVKADGKR